MVFVRGVHLNILLKGPEGNDGREIDEEPTSEVGDHNHLAIIFNHEFVIVICCEKTQNNIDSKKAVKKSIGYVPIVKLSCLVEG